MAALYYAEKMVEIRAFLSNCGSLKLATQLRQMQSCQPSKDEKSTRYYEKAYLVPKNHNCERRRREAHVGGSGGILPRENLKIRG